ncbi:hypothetical protein lerEdw1_008125 [Lerista edwardsae]|nr:hypothetical protein lerEdw1_008125 [Lerista edwardsae]
MKGPIMKTEDLSDKSLQSVLGFSYRSLPTHSQSTGGVPSLGPGEAPLQTNVTSNRRLQQTQAQVNEVVDIMRVNVDKVLERDQKLSELDNRADALQAGASQFETSAAKLKRKYWWKNCKFTSAPETPDDEWLGMALFTLTCFLMIHQMKPAF